MIGEPRFDIIITDGEFENQEDADLVGEFQKRRGPGVITYVLNLCLGSNTNIKLPMSFREIPLGVIDPDSPKSWISSDELRMSIQQIIINEMTREY